MIDLSYIDSVDLLNSIGIKNISISGGEITFSCPSEDHLHGDSRPSARMNVETTAFTCHSCGWRGNAIIFLSKYKSIPETVAKRLLEERYGGELLSSVGNLVDQVEKIMGEDKINTKEKRTVPSEEWIDKFNINWDIGSGYDLVYFYMMERGFTSKILDKWQIGYDKISNRITIPIRNHFGELVGFKGRAWNPEDKIKYLVLGDKKDGQAVPTIDGFPKRYGFDTYKKSEFVFNLDKYHRDMSYEATSIILVEGELNVIAMDQNGYPATLGIAGSEFSYRQCELIVEDTGIEHAVIFFDDDEAGRKGTRKIVEMLSPYMSLSVVQNAPGDAAELSKEQIDDLISGAEPALLLQAKGEL